jgi:hypothetical protein
MPAEKITITPAMHRQMGVDGFNATWGLLDKQDRSAEDDVTMIHTAHASAYHWLQVGEPLNFARSHWQISRVYAVLERAEPALYHADHCLEICLAEGIGDFDLAFAYEALARAYAVAENQEQLKQNLKLAQEAGDRISEKDDRHYFFDELATIPAP